MIFCLKHHNNLFGIQYILKKRSVTQ